MKILAIYGASILGLIIRPAGESVVLIVIAGLGSLMVKPSVVLGGFSTTTVWLVFVAFLISMAFAKTGIGARIAYLLIGVFGKTTLGLCYVMAIVDAVISPQPHPILLVPVVLHIRSSGVLPIHWAVTLGRMGER